MYLQIDTIFLTGSVHPCGIFCQFIYDECFVCNDRSQDQSSSHCFKSRIQIDRLLLCCWTNCVRHAEKWQVGVRFETLMLWFSLFTYRHLFFPYFWLYAKTCYCIVYKIGRRNWLDTCISLCYIFIWSEIHHKPTHWKVIQSRGRTAWFIASKAVLLVRAEQDKPIHECE